MSPEYSPPEETCDSSDRILDEMLDAIHADLIQVHEAHDIDMARAHDVPGAESRFFDCVSEGFPFPLDPARRQELTQAYSRADQELRALADTGSLQRLTNLDHEVLSYEMATRLRLLDTKQHLRPLDHSIKSAPWLLMRDGSGSGRHSFVDARDFTNFLDQTEGWPGWVNIAIENMRLGMRQGYTQPRCVIDMALQQFDDVLAPVPQSPFMKPFASESARLNPEERSKLMLCYQETIETVLNPAYQKLRDFVANEYRTACRPDTQPGLCALPGGVEEYQTLVEFYASSEVHIPELYQEAQEAVMQCVRAVDYIARESFGCGAEELVRRTYAPGPTRSLEEMNEICQKELTAINPMLEKLLPRDITDRPYRLTFPTDRLAATAASLYLREDPSSPYSGNVIIPVNSHFYPAGSIARALHHEILGHHLQSNAQQRSGHRFHTLGTQYPAFEEGWSMYAESFSADMRDNPDYQLAYHLTQLSIARGSVIDIGMHHLGWSWDQAITYRRAHLGVDSPESEQGDILRFIAWPGQVHAYFVGESLLQNLYDFGRYKLGPAFDDSAFNRQLIENGSLPLDILRKTSTSWIMDRLREYYRGNGTWRASSMTSC